MEPLIAYLITDVYRSAWYFTFMSKRRPQADTAESGADLPRFFMRHIVTQALTEHIINQLWGRSQPILKEAGRKNCCYFKHTSQARNA